MWPDLLGTIALAFNATVHSTTGYSPHELFYSFPPSCSLDVMVETPSSEPATNADQYALQAVECLQSAASFVHEMTGKSIQCMKRRNDASVKPQSYQEQEKVLYYEPCKKRGKFSKWLVCWQGPVKVERRLNDTNYVLRRTAKSKPFVVHVDRMRKLPQDALPDVESHGSCGDRDNTCTRVSSDIAPDKQQRPATQADGRGSVTVSQPTDSTGAVSPAEPANSTVESPTSISAGDTSRATSTADAGDATCIAGTGSTRCLADTTRAAQPATVAPHVGNASQLSRPQRQRRKPARLLCNVQVPKLLSSVVDTSDVSSQRLRLFAELQLFI